MGKIGKYFTSIVNITSDFVLQVKASCNAETLDLLNDTYRFLLSHHRTISESAMHTYYSALPFTPHDTRLYSLYKQETSHSITVLQGLSPTWTSCLSGVSFSAFYGSILSISPDGMWLAVSVRRRVLILDTRTTASQCEISLAGEADYLAFSPSESTLATVTYEGLGLWNTTTGINRKTQMLSGKAVNVHAMAFSSPGQYILLSIAQGLHLHHGTNGSELSVLSTDWTHNKIIFANDKQVITGSKEGYIHFFTLSGNQLSEIQERRIFNGSRVLGLVLRHDGKRLASSAADGTIRIYDLPSRLPIATLRRPKSDNGIRSIAYHPTEEELAVVQGNSVVLWRQMGTRSDWVPSIHSNHGGPITGIAYCQNGTRMYTNTLQGDVKLWTTTVTRAQEPPKHASYVNCFAVNQPTSLLATGSKDESIILWNFTTGDYWKTLLGHVARIDSLIFSDDGVLLASGSDNYTTIVWDVASGSPLHELGWHRSCDHVLAFSEDNTRLTTVADREYFKWELKSGELLGQSRRRGEGLDKGYTTHYYLEALNGWQTVVEESQRLPRPRKRCKYALFRSPGAEYRMRRDPPIFGNRVALLCDDGRVLILDISRVMHMYLNPACMTG